MLIINTTAVPNLLFERILKELKEAELKVLLIIIRQTNGWVYQGTNRRKTRDYITYNQFRFKTGLSRRIIGKSIQALIDKGYIFVSDYNNTSLCNPSQRKGKRFIYYSHKLNFKSSSKDISELI